MTKIWNKGFTERAQRLGPLTTVGADTAWPALPSRSPTLVMIGASKKKAIDPRRLVRSAVESVVSISQVLD